MCGGISHLHNSCNPGEVSTISARVTTDTCRLLEAADNRLLVIKLLLEEEEEADDAPNCVDKELVVADAIVYMYI
jgi:hypothetical protein